MIKSFYLLYISLPFGCCSDLVGCSCLGGMGETTCKLGDDASIQSQNLANKENEKFCTRMTSFPGKIFLTLHIGLALCFSSRFSEIFLHGCCNHNTSPIRISLQLRIVLVPFFLFFSLLGINIQYLAFMFLD